MKIKNKSGFSLIELMVVVAIIGVLASIAIPSVTKYMAKARQTEAKTNLAGYYTSQMAFFAEYNTFHGWFGAIGYQPEGALRYNVGSTNDVANLPFPEPTTLPANYKHQDTKTFCTSVAKSGSTRAYTAPCSLPIDTPALSTSPKVQRAIFTAEAITVLNKGDDVWTINEKKTINNTSSGI